MYSEKTKRRSIICACSFIIMLPLSWISVPGIGSFYRILIIAITALSLFFNGHIIRLPAVYHLRRYFRIYGLCILYFSASSFWSQNPSKSMVVAAGYVLLLCVLITFIQNCGGCECSVYNKCWRVIGVLWIILFFTGEKTTYAFTSRASLMILGTPTDANEFAAAIGVSVCIIISALFSEKLSPIKRLFYVCVLLTLIYIILMTGSRGGLIATFVGSVVTVLVCSKMDIKRILGIIIMMVLLSVILIYYIIPLLPADIIGRFTIDSLQKSGGSGRSEIWERGLSIFATSGILRTLFGYGTYGIDTWHNQIIQMLVDGGIVGLILYLIWMMKTFLLFVKYNKKYLGAFITLMIASLTISMGPSYKPLWVFLLMTFIKEEDVENETIYYYN